MARQAVFTIPAKLQGVLSSAPPAEVLNVLPQPLASKATRDAELCPWPAQPLSPAWVEKAAASSVPSVKELGDTTHKHLWLC